HGLGAAAATLGSFSVMFVLNYLVSRRYYEIPFEYSRIAKLVFLGVAMYLAVNWIPLTPELFSIAVKSMVAVSFPLLLYYMGFFDIQEIGTIKRYLVRTGVMNSRLKEADQ
ncbi:MAG: polysaccharide biosynthesis C-terminal domain-containing protein, partial [Syntrophales bacterium]